MTLQKVTHRQGQRHGDKLKQLGDVLSEDDSSAGDSSQPAAIDVSPPHKLSVDSIPEQNQQEEHESEEEDDDKPHPVVDGHAYSPNHAPHRSGGGATVRHMKSMSDIYFIG